MSKWVKFKAEQSTLILALPKFDCFIFKLLNTAIIMLHVCLILFFRALSRGYFCAAVTIKTLLPR